jgi:hypothetical protein
MNIKCYYRLCDKARMGIGYNWNNCFQNFIKNFQPNPTELVVYIDSSEDSTIKEAITICNTYGFENRVTKLGNSMSFYVTAQDALNNDDNTIIYFVENDYLHRRGSKEALFEIFSTFAKEDYATLYDHPDKYYPYFWDTNTQSYRNYCEIPENTNIQSRLFCLRSGWWRTVPTTCMTFACMAKTLKTDFPTIKKWTEPYGADRPKDFDMFNELILNGRKLYSPIPSYSGHTSLLPTGIDWRNT